MNAVKKTGGNPRPFLKWVGGKGQLLPELLERVRRAQPFARYHEPFVGGGALFFAMHREGLLGRKRAYLSDNNIRLVETYQALLENVDEVIALLEAHKQAHSSEHYYSVRAQSLEDLSLAERAARIIYLNKTCFNGLYRENSKGLFNVPLGKYKNPLICDAQNLHAVAVTLRGALVRQQHFSRVLEQAQPNDLVYFDPPYHPISRTSSYTAYHQGGFAEGEQRELAALFAELARRGVKVMLSNSTAPLILELYAEFQPEFVHASRLVNSNAAGRGKIEEVLVTANIPH